MISEFGGLLKKCRTPPIELSIGRRGPDLKRAPRRVAAAQAPAASSSRHARSAASATSTCSGVGSFVAIAVLELVARLRERAGERLARGSAPSSRRSRSRRRAPPSDAAARAGPRYSRGHRGRDGVRSGRRREQRPDQVRAAALVLARARLVVLVACRSRCARRRGTRRGRCRAATSSAGASASRPGSELLRDRPEPRAADDADADGAREHRGEHARLLERQLRLGQAPLAARAGRRSPRRAARARAGSGSRSCCRSSRLRSAATFSVPSGRRTAHAHEVGPCTSTPFRSAIPPRRSFSSAIAFSVAPLSSKRRLERRGGLAARDRLAVQLDDRHQLAHRRRRERLLGGGAGRRAGTVPRATS